ncbi:MAG: hypothetical protein KAY32_07455 [Candidatus Eisenbacteria sp.]|nr:hypothetical protein [Candidatus Eisenbacteria bacterium]
MVRPLLAGAYRSLRALPRLDVLPRDSVLPRFFVLSCSLALLVSVVPFVTPPSEAQFDDPSGGLSGGNHIRVWIEDPDREASYLNQFDLQFTRGAWTVAARLEFDEEERLDPESSLGIRRRYAEYHGDAATLRAGTFYATFGRGLLLRSEEDETVRIDRDLDGVHGTLHWRTMEGQAFVGQPRNDDTHERDDLLSGAEMNLRLRPRLRIGAGYVRMDTRDEEASEAHESDLAPGKPVEELFGGHIEWSHGILDAALEGARRLVWGTRDAREGWIGIDGEHGHAFYGSVALGVPGYSWLIEGKHYDRFDAPYSTLPPVNSDGQPINDGRDEYGAGVTLLASQGDVTYETAWSYATADDEPGERLAAEGSLRRDWWGRGALELGAEWIEETELESHSYRSYAGPLLEATYYLGPEVSLEFHGKFFAWTNEVRGSQRQQYNETTADLSLSFGASRAVTLSVLTASDPVVEYENDDTWISLELAWGFGYSQDLKIKIGDERGGVVCSGGICHYEPPFSGVRFELVSRF